MIQEKNGFKVGQKVYIRTYSDDGDIKKIKEYTVEKLYPNVVLLVDEKGIHMCPGYWNAHFFQMTPAEKNQISKTLKGEPAHGGGHLPRNERYVDLNEMQVSFARVYAKTGDELIAMSAAGYRSQGRYKAKRLLKNPKVQKLIKELQNGK